MVSKKMKMVALVGLLVSAFSLVTHIRLARRTYMDAISDYRQSFVAVFSSGRRIFDNADLLMAVVFFQPHKDLSLVFVVRNLESWEH